VVLATRHHKVYKATMNVRVIHRYQPREVGELIIWYLWLVLPFQRVMEQSLWGMDQGTDTSGQSEGRGHLSNNLWPRLASIGPEKKTFFIYPCGVPTDMEKLRTGNDCLVCHGGRASRGPILTTSSCRQRARWVLAMIIGYCRLCLSCYQHWKVMDVTEDAQDLVVSLLDTKTKRPHTMF
jgi:hypothetical protein